MIPGRMDVLMFRWAGDKANWLLSLTSEGLR
jgi:hypothetical protein